MAYIHLRLMLLYSLQNFTWIYFAQFKIFGIILENKKNTGWDNEAIQHENGNFPSGKCELVDHLALQIKCEVVPLVTTNCVFNNI